MFFLHFTLRKVMVLIMNKEMVFEIVKDTFTLEEYRPINEMAYYAALLVKRSNLTNYDLKCLHKLGLKIRIKKRKKRQDYDYSSKTRRF